jgi:hypothetical protein
MADFATVAELEGFLGTSALGARGTAMLGYASAAIRLFTRQDLEAVTGRQEEFAAEWNRYYISVTQRPVTALTMTVDAVAFTEFWANYISGDIYREDGFPWDEGPIIVTYDSGYAANSDEIASIKAICLEVAARALTGPPETFGLEVQELRGVAPAIYLTEEEKLTLGAYAMVGVG